MADKWILEGHEAVPCHDLMAWARWFETADRTVASDRIGDVRVSTVFLGINHAFGEPERLLLFETMIFGGKHDEYQTRCSTWGGAEEMHKAALDLVRGGVNSSDGI